MADWSSETLWAIIKYIKHFYQGEYKILTLIDGKHYAFFYKLVLYYMCNDLVVNDEDNIWELLFNLSQLS